MLENVGSRLVPYGWGTAQLTLTVLLWQASIGVFMLALVQQYLPGQLEANAAFPGYALAIYAGARFVCQTPIGWLADRLGRRQTLTFGLAISLTSVFLMFQVPSATLFLALCALYGVGASGVWPSIMAYVGDTHPPEQRGSVLNMMNLSHLVGLGLGTLAGVTLLDMISYQAAFVACMAVTAVALALAYRGASPGIARPRSDVQHEDQAGSRRGLFSPGVLLLAAIALLLSVGTTVQLPIIGAYTSEVLHTKMHVLALMMLLPVGVAAFLVVRFGHLADRFGRQAPLIGGLALAALGYFALSQTTHPLLAMNLVVLAGLGYAVSLPAWGAAALDASGANGRGLLMGTLATVQGLGGVAGPALGGVTNAAWGPLAPFKLGAAVLAVAMLLTVVHLRHHGRTMATALPPLRLARVEPVARSSSFPPPT